MGYSIAQQRELQRQACLQATYRAVRVARYPTEFASGVLLNDGSPEMNVNGNITPVTFRHTATQDALMTRINGVIVDAGIEPLLFGGIAALAKGLNFRFHDAEGNILLNLFGGALKANWEFSVISLVSTTIFQGATEDMFEFGIDLGGSGTTLYMKKNDYVELTINDDLTALSRMRVAILGYNLISEVPPLD